MNSVGSAKTGNHPILVPWPVAILVVAVVYALVAKVAVQVTVLPGDVAPVFPDVGIALAAVLLFGRIALFGVWLGAFAVNAMSFFNGAVLSGQSALTALLVAAFIGLGIIAFAGSGAFLVRRFCKDEYSLYSGGNMLLLVMLGAILCCMVSPTLGVLSLSLGGYVPWDRFTSSWVTWYTGDAAGGIVVVPLILAWHFKNSCREKSWLMLEMAVLGVVTLLLCIFVLFQRNAHFEYCLVPLALWAAFRFGTRGALSAVAVLGLCGMIGSHQSNGLFAGSSANESLMLLYAFLGVAIIAALFLAGILAERKRAGEALLLTQFSVDHASEAIMWMTPDARIVDVNEAACRSLGYTREDLLKLHISDIDVCHNAHDWPEYFKKLRQCGSLTNESELRTRDGRLIPVETVANHIQFGTEQRNCTFIRDITERKRAETYRDMRSEILQILNEPDDLPRSLQRVLHTLKTRTGVDAMGIRLKDGEDFPYFVQLGFPEEFVRSENSLISYGMDGLACRSSQGKVQLECACGLVIGNRSLPDSPLFTRRGSFWTNDSFALGSMPCALHPVQVARNQCIRHGYASVALVPIRIKDQIVGLLQLNDHRQGVFSLTAIEQMESIAEHLGQAMLRSESEHQVGTLLEESLKTRQSLLSIIEDASQTEADLKRLATAIEQVAEIIVITDAHGVMQYVNPAFETVTGYTREEAIGRNPRMLKSGQQEQAFYATMWKTVSSGKIWQGRFINRKKDGALYTEEATISPVRDATGEISSYVAVMRDITAQQQAEAELQMTNRNLEETTQRANQLAHRAELANIAKSEFLANMSHEIRTPMNGVIGMNGLLLDTELSDEQRNYAEIVHSSGEAMLALINDILDFSKIEAKKLDLETLDFDLSSLLEDFTASLVLQAHSKGLELLCRVDLEVPELLRGDPGRLRQILANLTDNAIKFTPSGEVEVRVALLEEADQQVLLRFSVRDTGPGIAKNKTGMLFEKFSQVDASTTRQYGGTGLGLAISKHLAEMMGGEIGVTSEEGQGSEFWFTSRLGRQVQDSRAMTAVPATLRAVRVLIVDDNATHRDILSTRLASWEMRPSDVPNAPRALDALAQALAERDPFRLLLIDMQMPGMDGAELGRMIRAEARWADTQMVILTSLGAGDNPKDFEEIGFAAYVTKPTGHQELRTILSRVIEESATEDSKPHSIVMRRIARETLLPFQDRKWRILLAEDNITNQQVALNILRKLGLRADAVANGAEALKVLETIPYDLVLMDVQMPEMDGFEATRRIRSRRSTVRNPQVPIIAMTANAMQGDREKCLEVEMDDYVPKPVSPQSLAKVLKKWLPRENPDEPRHPLIPEIPPGAVPQNSAPQVFDRSAMLARLMDDVPLMHTVLQTFLLDIPQQISALKGYLDSGDIPSAVRQAHTIKGASANVGGDRLRETAYKIEQAARLGDLLAVARDLPALEAEFEALKLAMTQQA